MLKKSDVWKPTESMSTFLLVLSSLLCFHYVSISTNFTEAEAVNITLFCNMWRVKSNHKRHWLHGSSKGWLIFQIKCVEAERKDPWILLKYTITSFSLLIYLVHFESSQCQNLWLWQISVFWVFLWHCVVIVHSEIMQWKYLKHPLKTHKPISRYKKINLQLKQ